MIEEKTICKLEGQVTCKYMYIYCNPQVGNTGEVSYRISLKEGKYINSFQVKLMVK